MFERFTERARQVVVLAQEEARILKHNYIGTEHILLGLLREEEGQAAAVVELCRPVALLRGDRQAGGCADALEDLDRRIAAGLNVGGYSPQR